MLIQGQNFLPLFPKIDINQYSQIHVIDIENIVGEKPRRGSFSRRDNYIEKVNSKLSQYVSKFSSNKSLFIISLTNEFCGLKNYQFKTNKLKNIYSIPAVGNSGADNVLIYFLHKHFLNNNINDQRFSKEIFIATGDKDFLPVSQLLSKKFGNVSLVLSEEGSFNKNLIQFFKKCIFMGNFETTEELISKFIRHYIYSALGKFSVKDTYELFENINFTFIHRFEPGQRIVETTSQDNAKNTHLKTYHNETDSDDEIEISIQLKNTKFSNKILGFELGLQDSLSKICDKKIRVKFTNYMES